MINEEIISYIKNAKEHGITLDAIRMNLKTGGWNDADIDEAFAVTERSIASNIVPPFPQKPQDNSASIQMNNTSFVSQNQNGFVGGITNMPAKKKSHWVILTILILVFLILGGTGFAFYKKIIPLPSFITKYLDKAPYDEQNLISGLLFKMAQIKTVKYTVATEVSLGARDADVKPLILTGDLAPTSFDQTEYFPTEFKLNTSITAETDLSNLANSDWKINLDTSGDLGDLYYQINIDSLKKGKNIYFKVNNLPALFSFFPFPKSQWFLLDFDSIDEIAKQHLTDKEYEEFKSGTEVDGENFQKQLLEYESKYKENREKSARIMKKFILMADEYKILAFKEPPLKDEITVVPLYRYSLMFRPGTLTTFVEAFMRDVLNEEFPEDREENEKLIAELKSENAIQIMNYIEENTTILFWVDQNGLPESMKFKFRFVPGNVSGNFNEKQINFETNLKLANINAPIVIDAPANAKSFFQYIFDSLESASIKANNAKIISNLSSLRAEAELYFDSKGNYGGKTSGGCAVSGTIFNSPRIANLLNEIKNIQIQENLQGKTACFSNKDAYAITTPLLDVGDGQKYFCVDSAGTARETRSHAIAPICPGF